MRSQCKYSILAGVFTACIMVPPSIAQQKQVKQPDDPIDRSAPRPPSPHQYKVSDDYLHDFGLAYGRMSAYPNKCYGDLSISDKLFASFKARGFSLQALCLAITSPWVRYNPESGKPLAVVSTDPDHPPRAREFILEIPGCFKHGTPFLDCNFNFEHFMGVKYADTERHHIHDRALEVDAAVRKLIANGNFAAECSCANLSWDNKQEWFIFDSSCKVESAPACIERMSGRKYREGSLILEVNGGYYFKNVPTEGGTDYGGFDISPELPRGYAYRIGSPEGDDDSPYSNLPPGRKIGIGTD